MKLFPFFIIIFFPTVTLSQGLQVGITGNIGLSKMYSKTLQHEYVVQISQYVLSGNAGIVCEKDLSKKSSLGFELL